eukprot:811325-Pyramimonas_sp.AAC.1
MGADFLPSREVVVWEGWTTTSAAYAAGLGPAVGRSPRCLSRFAGRASGPRAVQSLWGLPG